MLKEQVIIKQIPDDFATTTGLDKYQRSRMPGCFDRLYAGKGDDGRYATGIDENSLPILMISDKTERDRIQEDTKNLREKLEKLVGKDLSALSDFWKTFFVELSSDSDLILNRTNAYDVIKYHLLIANEYVAPSKEEAGDPRFRNCKYFAFSKENENKERVSMQKLRDKARSELLKISEDKDRMVLLGQFLEGMKYNSKAESDNLYAMLSDFIENRKEPDNIAKFMKAIKKPVDELVYKVIIDKAIRNKIIVWRDKYYQRGQVTLGKNI